MIYGINSSRIDPGYSEVLGKMKEGNAQLFVNSAIISEYINTTTRIAASNYQRTVWQSEHRSKKFNYKQNYRPTKDFEENYFIAIESAKEEILKDACLIQISQSQISNALQCINMLDFNDQLIVNNAMDNHLSILTDDRDYLKIPTEINIFRLN